MAEGDGARPDAADRLRRVGVTAWWILGIGGVLVALGYLASLLSLVIVPVVLALFPATLLLPVARWLKGRGVPAGAAAIVSLVGGVLLIVAVIGLMVPLVTAELPGLIESASEGVAELEEFLAEGPLGLEIDGISDLLRRAGEQLGGEDGEDGQATQALVTAFEGLAGFLLMLVLLFFYLKDDVRLGRGIVEALPERVRGHVRDAGIRTWDTIGPYFRGQLLVALVDAVFIGLGLVLLGVPLALPLAVLIFFGGMFPIVGAVTTGTLAVLVAFADGGLTMGLIVLALVLGVQQLESNVLEPYILGRVVHLHPLVVLLSITAGAVLLNILGAFLAVPVATVVARTIEDVRGGG